MRKFGALNLLFFAFSISILAQDIDVFKRDLNDHFNIPQIPTEMTYEEFQLLSTNFRLMDAMEAIIVPGLIHFKVNDNKTGWSLLGVRLVGYSGLIYVNYNKVGLWSDVLNSQQLNSEESNSIYYIALGSVALVAGSYLYDWIHGRSLLESKQHGIRYKYSIKINPQNKEISSRKASFYPELSISATF